MLKKSLLSLAVAAGLGLAGCSGTDSTGSVGANGGNPDQRGTDQGSLDLITNPGTYPLYDPAASVLPVPSDAQFSGTSDGTIVFDGETQNQFQFVDPDTGSTGANFNPVTNAMADLDGNSVIAQIDLPFSGAIDPDSVVANRTVFLVPLNPCQDADGNDLDPITGCLANGSLSYVNPSALDGTDPTSISESFGTATSFRAEVIDQTDRTAGSVLRITPLEPMASATRYMVFLTNGIKEVDGVTSVNPSNQYNAISGDEVIPIALEGLRSLVQGYELLASGYVSTILSNDLGDLALSAENVGLLTDLGVDPTTIVDEATGTAAVLQAAAATPDSIVMSYSFTTGGTNQVLSVMTAPGLANSALQAAQAHPTVAATFNAPQGRTVTITKTETIEGMDVRIGTIDLPYFLRTPSFYQDLALAADETAQATGVNVINAKWQSNDGIDDLAAELGEGFEALGAVTPPSEKVTRFFPFAKAQADSDGNLEPLQAPIAVFLPSAAPTQTIIYQHGITKNRTKAIAFAKEMTDAGYAVIAMDLVLHGLEPTDFVDGSGLIDLTSLGAQMSPLNSATVDGTAILVVAAEAAGVDVATVQAAIAAVLGGSPTDTEQAIYDVYASVDAAVTAVETNGTAALADESVAEAYTGYSTAVLGQYMLNENHFGLTTDDGTTPRAIDSSDLSDDEDAANKTDESGSLYVYPLHFQITRDNLRQSVMNLLNLGASIDNIDTAIADVAFPATHNGTVSTVNFVGHSFGAVVGASYASVNNTVGYYNVNNNVIVGGLLDETQSLPSGTGSALLTSALPDSSGNVTCGNAVSEVAAATNLTEAEVEAALAAAGVSTSTAAAIGCGNSNLPHLQTVTLVNGSGSLAKLNEHSPIYAPPVLAGLAALGVQQSSSSFEAFINVLQATLDSVDPMSLSAGFSSPLVSNTTGILSIEVEDDNQVVNSADDGDFATDNFIYAKAPVANSYNSQTGFTAPLVGTEALIVEMGSTNITAGTTGDPNNPAVQNVAVRFTAVSGADHNSFEMESLLTDSADTNEQEMSAIVQTLLQSSGTVVGVGSVAPTSIETQTTP